MPWMASIVDNEVKLEVDMNVVRALESVDDWSGITPGMIFNLHIPGLKKSSFTLVMRIKRTAVSSVRTNSIKDSEHSLAKGGDYLESSPTNCTPQKDI